MLEQQYFAVAQLNGPVYGLGFDDVSAKFDALENLDDFDTIHELEDILVSPEDAEDGEYFVCECSEEFYDYINTFGGNVLHNTNKKGILTKK